MECQFEGLWEHEWGLHRVPYKGRRPPASGPCSRRSCLPGCSPGAGRLGLVSLAQMVNALAHAVEAPPPPGEVRVLDVSAIRRQPG